MDQLMRPLTLTPLQREVLAFLRRWSTTPTAPLLPTLAAFCVTRPETSRREVAQLMTRLPTVRARLADEAIPHAQTPARYGPTRGTMDTQEQMACTRAMVAVARSYTRQRQDHQRRRAQALRRWQQRRNNNSDGIKGMNT